MSSFLTQCPHCLTSFRVTEKQLDAAEGLVRCGACLGIFSAAANRITVKPSPEAQAAAEEEFIDEEFDEDMEEDDYLDDEIDGEMDDGEEIDVDAPDDDSDAADEALLDDRDFDIPLGDLNLDSEASADEEEADELDEDEDDDEEEEDEYVDAEDAALEEDDDEDDLVEEEEIYEEYGDEVPAASVDEETETPDYEDEFEPEFLLDEEDEEDPDEDDEAADEDNEATGDKTRLRNYLADISDDEALDPIDDDALEDLDEPVMLEAAPRRSRLASFGLLCGIGVFAALLAWQYAAANIDRLSRSASFAPLLPYACRVLDCPAPQRVQPERFVSEQLLVRSHPEYAEALEVNLVFRNDATEAQPFPALELGLHDSANRLIANRLFAPAEYLPPELQTSEMPPQSSLQVTLELVDPGSDAVNYALAFRAP